MKWLALLLCLLPVSLACAQSAADMADEPHYRLLLKNDDVRVFALTLAPTEQAYVHHEHNFLTVTLQDCDIIVWSEGQSPIQTYHFSQGDARFSYAKQAIGIRNDRTTEYRNITVEFLNPKVMSIGYRSDIGQWGNIDGAIPPAPDPHTNFISGMNLQAALVVEAQLLSGDSLKTPEKPANELLIPVTDVDLKNHDGVHIRKISGDVIPIGKNRKSELENAGTDTDQFVMVQLLETPSE